MRSTYGREMQAREILGKVGVECYVPMKMERTEKGTRLVPAVHNLIFVRTERSFMDSWKRGHEEDCPLRYAMDSATGKPMIVRDREMEDFVRVTDAAGSEIMYLDNPAVTIERGKEVEIVVGQYAGVRGKIIRILRDRKVVVSVGNVVAVAISGIPFAWMREV